jgi:hypothetical protein
MQKLLTSVLVVDTSEPYSNTIVTIIAILTVFQLVRDIFKEKK